MDINRLRYFCTLAQTGNVRKAAELLRLSPPALSKAIRVLEKEVGFPLIAPSGRGIVITDRGRKLAERAPRVLRELDALRESEGEPAGDAPLRIGSFEVFTTYFLGELVSRVLPERKISVHELIPGHIENALNARQIDLGITYIPIPSPDLDHLKVAEIEMGVYGRADAGFHRLPVSQLPFAVPIAPISGSPTKAQGLDGWPDDRIPRAVKYRVTLMESAMELCRQGRAVAYLPSFVVKLHNKSVLEKFRLKEFPLPGGLHPQRQGVYLVKRKSDMEEAQIRKIAKMLRMVACER